VFCSVRVLLHFSLPVGFRIEKKVEKHC
jgi:hypothetical protein